MKFRNEVERFVSIFRYAAALAIASWMTKETETEIAAQYLQHLTGTIWPKPKLRKYFGLKLDLKLEKWGGELKGKGAKESEPLYIYTFLTWCLLFMMNNNVNLCLQSLRKDFGVQVCQVWIAARCADFTTTEEFGYKVVSTQQAKSILYF